MKLLSTILISILICSACSKDSNRTSSLPRNTIVVEAKNKPTSAPPKENSAKVISQHANLRDADNSDAAVLGQIAQDSSVEVIKQQGGWFYVKTDAGLQGWMHGNTLRLERFNESLPSTTTVTRRIPTPAPFVSAPEPETNHSGASAKCRDGSLSFSAHRRGTCSHHGGVAEWY